jgi:hypothetical protein
MEIEENTENPDGNAAAAQAGPAEMDLGEANDAARQFQASVASFAQDGEETGQSLHTLHRVPNRVISRQIALNRVIPAPFFSNSSGPPAPRNPATIQPDPS